MNTLVNASFAIWIAAYVTIFTVVYWKATFCHYCGHHHLWWKVPCLQRWQAQRDSH